MKSSKNRVLSYFKFTFRGVFIHHHAISHKLYVFSKQLKFTKGWTAPGSVCQQGENLRVDVLDKIDAIINCKFVQILDESSMELLLDNESRSTAETSLKGVEHPLNMLQASISIRLTPRENSFRQKLYSLQFSTKQCTICQPKVELQARKIIQSYAIFKKSGSLVFQVYFSRCIH